MLVECFTAVWVDRVVYMALNVLDPCGVSNPPNIVKAAVCW